MKKPNFKKQKQGITVSPLKTRNFLHELHPNLMASRNIIKKKLTTEEKKQSECLIYRLSDELLVSILQFLNPRDLVLSVQLVCKDWRRITSDTRFWKLLESDNGLDLWWKVCRTSCIVERRSKGKLYRGYLRTTRQPVTLRNIFLDVTNAGQDDGVPTSVLREVSYLANMQSEFVAEFLGAQVNGSQALICMELTPWNLKEYLRRFLYEENVDKYYFKNNSWDKTVRYRIPLPEVKSIMYQILQALNYIHHRGIMHRNLKSDNILITTQGTVKISDFALSRQCTIPHTVYTPEDPKERDRSGREARRLWYRPPELLCRKEMYSFEVDIWAAGCMLAEICLNEPLFNGETEIEQLFKIFRFTGCPESDAFPGYNVGFPKWSRVEFKNVMANKQSKEFNHVCKVLVPNRESTFHKLVSIGSVIGPEGLDLLQKLLELDPSKRISAAQALRHPFFGQIPSICCTHVTYPSFTMPECQLLSYISSLREIELKSKFDFQYLKKQPNITEMMRAILIDWLVDVSVHFELLDETLHIAVALIDKTLSKVKTDRTRLQLIGVTCMKIADVYNEKSKEYYRQENANEYAYITAEEYSAQEVIEMEKHILNLHSFRIQSPTVLSFLKSYQAVVHLDSSCVVLAHFIADLLLLSYEGLKFAPSLLASAVLFVSCSTLGTHIPAEMMARCRELFQWYSLEEFHSCVVHVRDFWLYCRNNPQYARFEAILTKYESRYAIHVRDMLPAAFAPACLERWWY